MEPWEVDETTNVKPKGNKIGLNDNFMSSMVKMAEGNPGAVTVMMEMIKKLGEVDGYMTILMLDDQHIYGPQIWMNYKDVYGQDLDKFIEATRSYKLNPK